MNNTEAETLDDGTFILYHVKFAILLSLQVLAIALSILIFIYFTKHRALLKAPHNHGLLLLLVVNSIQLVFDMPLSLSFYMHGYVNPSIPSYCIWWTFFEYIITAASEYILAIIALQRHLFIFHQNILRNRWMRYLLHYLPLSLCIVYPTLFYFFAIIVYPCDNTQWDYTSKVCGFANCYLVYGTWLGLFDLVFNNSVPVVIDIVANAILILRVILQKLRARQSVRWQQQRRMIVQLFCLSGLYLIAWTPFLLVQIVNVSGNPTFLNYVEKNYFSDLLYIVYFFLPWMWLGFFPKITRWIMQCFRRQRADNVLSISQPRSFAGTMKTSNVTRAAEVNQSETKL